MDLRAACGARGFAQSAAGGLTALLATDDAAAELESAAMATAPVPRPRVEIVDRRVISSLVPPDAVHQGFAALARPLPA